MRDCTVTFILPFGVCVCVVVGAITDRNMLKILTAAVFILMIHKNREALWARFGKFLEESQNLNWQYYVVWFNFGISTINEHVRFTGFLCFTDD